MTDTKKVLKTLGKATLKATSTVASKAFKIIDDYANSPPKQATNKCLVCGKPIKQEYRYCYEHHKRR